MVSSKWRCTLQAFSPAVWQIKSASWEADLTRACLRLILTQVLCTSVYFWIIYKQTGYVDTGQPEGGGKTEGNWRKWLIRIKVVIRMKRQRNAVKESVGVSDSEVTSIKINDFITLVLADKLTLAYRWRASSSTSPTSKVHEKGKKSTDLKSPSTVAV